MSATMIITIVGMLLQFAIAGGLVYFFLAQDRKSVV